MKYSVLLYLIVPLSLYATEKKEQKLQWPLKGNPKLSASFGEYRGRRFHMGIDLSTAGVEGLKVYPIADGVVFKVKAQRRGYGNSIYIQHSNGRVSVYAHLAAFGPKIEEKLLSQKVKLGSYFGVKTMKVAVKQQDIIAYSGESGSGLPHLHFEIRDASNQPLDPIREGLSDLLPSRENLVVKAIRLSPLSPGSIVNGSSFPVEICDFSRPVQAEGLLGIEILGYVLLTNSNRLGFRAIELKQDGETLSSWKPSTLSYDFNRQAGNVFNRVFSGFSPTQYVYRFNHTKDPALPSYSFNSTLNVETETTLTLSLGGVTSSKTITMKLNPKVALRKDCDSFSRKKSDDLTLWQGRIRYQDPSSKETQIRVLQPGSQLSGPFLPQKVKLVGRLPGKPNQHFQMGEWTIKSSMPSHLVSVETVSNARQGLSPVSSILNFEDGGALVSGLVVTWKLSEALKRKEQLGLYSWSPNKGKWRFEESVIRAEGKFELPFFSKCVILRDTKKPILGKIKTHRYFKGRKKVIRIKDRESGVDWKKTRLSMNGKKVSMDVDNDRGWIILPNKLQFPLKVATQDKAGNKSMSTYKGLK